MNLEIELKINCETQGIGFLNTRKAMEYLQTANVDTIKSGGKGYLVATLTREVNDLSGIPAVLKSYSDICANVKYKIKVEKKEKAPSNPKKKEKR